MNVVEVCDENYEMLIEQVQDVIDSPDMDLPEEATSPEDVMQLQRAQAYYSEMGPYLVGLWGAMRFAARRNEPLRVAGRDYLEKCVSSCGRKYDAASRLLTGYQALQNESRGMRTF